MKKWYIVIFIVGVLSFSFWYYTNYNKIVAIEGYVTDDVETLSEIETEPSTIMVYIAGEVAKPDVYIMPSDARVIDLIEEAGGLTGNADISDINLAGYVEDAQKIVVKNINETVDKTSNSIQNSNVGNLININTADLATLKELSGVGDVIGKAIIEYREENGGFKNIDEIKNVSGIGDKIFEKIKDKIVC